MISRKSILDSIQVLVAAVIKFIKAFVHLVEKNCSLRIKYIHKWYSGKQRQIMFPIKFSACKEKDINLVIQYSLDEWTN